MASSTTGMMITLKSNDGEEFVITELVAIQSQTIRHMIEDNCAQNAIPLPNVNAKILAKVIEFCKHHAEADNASKEDTAGEGTSSKPTSSKVPEEELQKWDQKFVDVDLDTVYNLLLAANYLNIKKLLDEACQKAANMIKGKSPEKIRQNFNIVNDLSPEEQVEIQRENQWAFE